MEVANRVAKAGESLDSAFHARALETLGRQRAGLGEFAEAEETLREAFRRSGPLGLDDVAADAATTLVKLVGHEGDRHAEALVWGEIAGLLIERLGTNDPPRQLRLWKTIALVHVGRSAWEDARTILRALSLARQALETHRTETRNMKELEGIERWITAPRALTQRQRGVM